MEKDMSQELRSVNERHESAKKAILKRLSYQNLKLDDLLAAKAYAEIMQCQSYIKDDMTIAFEKLQLES